MNARDVGSDEEGSMHRFAMFVCGALTGAAVGGILAILMAPQPGADTRAQINARLEEVRADAARAYEEKRRELLAEYNLATERKSTP
jgi:gas vesicle protein